MRSYLKIRAHLAVLGVACAAAVALAAAGCADHPYNPNGPAIDPNSPVVHITAPARGTQLGDTTHVVVAGTATDDVGVTSLTVNGVPANLASDGTFTVTVPVTAGTNLLHAVAADAQGNTGKESRAVSAGPLAPIDTEVVDALTASISAQTFDKLGQAIGGYLKTEDLASFFDPPIKADGTPGKPVVAYGLPTDCNFAQAWVTGLTMTDAVVTLQPQAGGLAVDVELTNVTVNMHVTDQVLCLGSLGQHDIVLTADHLSVVGPMTIGILNNQFDIHFDNPKVTLTNFMVHGALALDVLNWLSLDTAMSPIIGWAIGKFAIPMVNNLFAGLNSTKQVMALGKTIDISILPATITFDVTGAIIELDTTLRAEGDAGSAGFVYVPNALPAMDTSHGFQLAVADDAVNQLLASFYAAKGMDVGIDLKTGSYGAIGQLYDHVDIQAMIPPFVDASGGKLKLTVGDLMLSFKTGETVTTAVVVNAEVGLVVNADPVTGALRIDVGQPTTYVDVLDQGVMGANQLSNSEFEAIASFALGRVIAVASGTLGAVPLPTIGGVSLHNVTAATQTGYLVVNGELQ
jgi:hypothetical protein